MRYDKPIYFQKITPGQYDQDTGDYADDIILETKKYASIMDTGTEVMRLVYGSIRQGSKTIQLQTPYRAVFDFIRIGRKVYGVDYARQPSMKQVFVVSEVQDGRT